MLLKHSDPRLAFPEESFGPDGNVRADHEVFAFSDPKRVPKYITWDAELQHAMADRAFVLNQLLVRTETSPVLLGLKEGRRPGCIQEGPPGELQQPDQSRPQGRLLAGGRAAGDRRRARPGERR